MIRTVFVILYEIVILNLQEIFQVQLPFIILFGFEVVNALYVQFN